MANVTAQSLAGFQTLLTTGGHSILADEPKGIGTGLGLDPYELLLGALGACTAMTVRMYADRKGWPLVSVKAELSHDRVHASDCRDCEQDDGIVERIKVRIHFEGDLDAAQRERLAYIATRCPVRKTLAAGPHISDEVV